MSQSWRRPNIGLDVDIRAGLSPAVTNLDVAELAIGNVNSDTNVRVLPVEQVVRVAPSFI